MAATIQVAVLDTLGQLSHLILTITETRGGFYFKVFCFALLFKASSYDVALAGMALNI